MTVVVPQLAGDAMVGRAWPYSPQYESNLGEGHGRPPPEFGAPTLVWHLGLWQAELEAKGDSESAPDVTRSRRRTAPTDEERDFELRRQKTRDAIDARNSEFFDAVSTIIEQLQERGAIASDEATLRFAKKGGCERNKAHEFVRVEPQSIAFTLWWQDGASASSPNRRQHSPASTDLRVRVVAQSNFEHATMSFFIDAGKPWNGTQVFASAEAQGTRRRRVFQLVEHLRKVSDEQIARGWVDNHPASEALASAEDAQLLLTAADYLFEGVWRDLVASFGLPWPLRLEGKNKGDKVEVFADLKGLVHSVGGLENTPRDAQRVQQANTLREPLRLPPISAPGGPQTATVGIGRLATFDRKAGEPNTVLKAHLPFIRRMAPDADRRDLIGCGILDWRCLLVSPLGSQAEPFSRDEGIDADAPFGHLPPTPQPHDPQPIRYLLLTKHEPHRQQIGRFVERINAVTTMRLFALKHWADIRNAGSHLRVLGRELDDVLSDWSAKRQQIESKAKTDKDAEEKRLSLRRLLQLLGLELPDPDAPPRRMQKIYDDRLKNLNELIKKTERHLIDHGGQFDRIGRKGAGKLLYAIRRSQQAIEEFRRMERTLEVGNVDGWINHSQFVARGIKPIFDQIENIGQMLLDVRNRLQMITEMIQTSALIVEAEATSGNTQTLRKIASHWLWTRVGVLGVVATLALNLFVGPEQAQGMLRQVVQFITALLTSATGAAPN